MDLQKEKIKNSKSWSRTKKAMSLITIKMVKMKRNQMEAVMIKLRSQKKLRPKTWNQLIRVKRSQSKKRKSLPEELLEI